MKCVLGIVIAIVFNTCGNFKTGNNSTDAVKFIELNKYIDFDEIRIIETRSAKPEDKIFFDVWEKRFGFIPNHLALCPISGSGCSSRIIEVLQIASDTTLVKYSMDGECDEWISKLILIQVPNQNVFIKREKTTKNNI